MAICQWRFPEQRSFYLREERQLLLSCIRQIIVSPLAQGGLEIPCLAEIQMPPALKNRETADLYQSMIDISYDSREKDFLLGSFLSTNEEIESTHAACSSSARKKKKIGKENPQHKNSDIWSFFHVTYIVSSTTSRDDADMDIFFKTITIDD